MSDAREALSDSFEIRITRESPYTNRPNMFKNVVIGSSSDFVNTISGYDRKRSNTFKRKVPVVKKISILRQDLLRGFVEFTMRNPGSQELFATLTKSNLNVPLAGQVINFKNDPLVKLYATPRADFIVGDATVFRNKTRIVITPQDKRIARFDVRVSDVVDNVDVPDANKKTLSTNVTNEGLAYLDIVDTGDFKKNVKITPVSFYKNIGSSEYREIVLNKDLIYNNQCVLYPTVDNGSSATFTVRSIPSGVIFITLLRKNLSKLHKNFTVVATSSSVGKSILLTDPFKQAYDTFLYKVQFEFKDGTRQQSAASYVLQPKLISASVQLNVTEVENDEGDPTNTRKYATAVVYNNTTSTQSLLTDLKNLGIDNIFPNEVKNLSTQLDPLLGIVVKRINLTTCAEERIGLFKPGEIKVQYDDLTPAVLIFEVVLKPAVEIIEDIASSRDFSTTSNGGRVGDPMSSSRALGLTTFAKRDNFTQKFFNRFALYYGTLKYGKSLSSSEAGIEAGKTGIFRNVLLYPSVSSPALQFTSVRQRLGDKVITWKATNLKNVDRFEIYDTTNQNNIKMIAKSVADDNRLDFSISIPTNVSKVTIQAIGRNEAGTSIEADV